MPVCHLLACSFPSLTSNTVILLTLQPSRQISEPLLQGNTLTSLASHVPLQCALATTVPHPHNHHLSHSISCWSNHSSFHHDHSSPVVPCNHIFATWHHISIDNCPSSSTSLPAGVLRSSQPPVFCTLATSSQDHVLFIYFVGLRHSS